jgi:hypothetical protein
LLKNFDEVAIYFLRYIHTTPSSSEWIDRDDELAGIATASNHADDYRNGTRHFHTFFMGFTVVLCFNLFNQVIM